MVVEDARHTVLIKRSCGDSFYCQLCKKIVDGDPKEHLESKGHTRKATGAVTSVSLSPKSTLGSALGKAVTLHGSTFCVDAIKGDASNLTSRSKHFHAVFAMFLVLLTSMLPMYMRPRRSTLKP